MESKAKKRLRAQEIARILAETYPEAKCSLNFKNPYQLLVATILSAQCTDERVNQVTPALFKVYPKPSELAAAPLEEIEEHIRTTGFFRNKAKSLQGMASQVVENHGGKVPGTMEELHKLPGVGRKTANVVLGNCFNTPGLTIDTHMSRVNQRLGLTKHEDPEKIERDLMDLLPRETWTLYSHRVIYHGRAICQARKPLCERCPVAHLCDYFAKFQNQKARVERGKTKTP